MSDAPTVPMKGDGSLRAHAPSVPTEGHEAAVVGWRPIETAPRDGTRIIARIGTWLPFECAWDGERFIHDDPEDGLIAYTPDQWWAASSCMTCGGSGLQRIDDLAERGCVGCGGSGQQAAPDTASPAEQVGMSEANAPKNTPAPTEKGDGWVLVPREPTDAMLDAGAMALLGQRSRFTDHARVVWSAMIAATQQATGGECAHGVDRRMGCSRCWADAVSVDPAVATQQAVSPPEGVWRPIETAPRDGTEFIAYSQDVTGTTGLNPFVSLCAWHPDAGFCTCELREPTHWMPLPCAPDAIGEEKGAGRD